jgi:hypothetical protein
LTATAGWYFTVARAPLPGQAPLLPRGLLAAGTKIFTARPECAVGSEWLR